MILLSWVCVGYAPMLLTGCAGTWLGNLFGFSPRVPEPVLMVPEEKQAYAKKHHLQLDALDLNRDGTPDIYNFYAETASTAPDTAVQQPGSGAGSFTPRPLVRKEIDLNHDGHADVIRTYGEAGQLATEEVDLDFDGKIDEISQYQQGRLITRTMDLNNDHVPDVFKYYTAQGQLERIESDRNGDGKVDTWEYFEAGVLVRIGHDFDGDTKVDTWERVTSP